jgi:hypothetical protein
MGSHRSNNYNEENLDALIQAVKKGMAVKTVAKLRGVPRSTLQFHFSERFSKTAHRPAPTLSEDEENTLVRCVVTALAVDKCIIINP